MDPRLEPKGIILSGGPESVYDDGRADRRPRDCSTSRPVLGICYGMQLIAQLEGGEVSAPASGSTAAPR